MRVALEIPERISEQVELFFGTLASSSERSYRTTWRHWTTFLGAGIACDRSDAKILTASPLHVQAYFKDRSGAVGIAPRDGLGSHQLSGNTLASEYTRLRATYAALLNAGSTTKNPFAAVQMPVRDVNEKRPTTIITREEVRRLLDRPGRGTKQGLRDTAIITLFFGCGLRLSELAKLRVGDIGHTSDGVAFARLRKTKNGRDLDKAIQEWAAETVVALVRQRVDEGAAPTDPLWVNYYVLGDVPGAPMSDKTIYKHFKIWARESGLPPTITPHSARATAITHLLDIGLTHREVQEFSGHKCITMVERYDKRRVSLKQSSAHKLKY